MTQHAILVGQQGVAARFSFAVMYVFVVTKVVGRAARLVLAIRSGAGPGELERQQCYEKNEDETTHGRHYRQSCRNSLRASSG